jgi:hypothetical protein
MSKKSRKRNKKILAALALAGGAAMLGRGKGAVTGVVNPNAPKSNWITKKAVVEPAAVTTGDSGYLSRMSGAGDKAAQLASQRKRANYATQARIDALNTAEGPPSIDNPYRAPINPNRFNRLKGGGIAKRGTGVALKRGGRVKSMGIAKRGGGAAKR